MSKDTNFDDLAEHFEKRIYGSRKGKIRLAVLERDLRIHIPNLESSHLQILDIGAGLAQMGIQLAQMGHHVCINDISANMLALAKKQAEQHHISKQITWHHGPLQSLSESHYDVILCHAVLEWLHEPKQLFEKLSALASVNTVVSLMFYNFDALVFHNLIRGNFKKVNNSDFSGMKGGLTPPNPLKPSWVEDNLQTHGFEVFYKSGVRVFSDYVGVKHGGNAHDEDVLKMELEYSSQLPYLNLGRYIHYLCRRA